MTTRFSHAPFAIVLALSACAVESTSHPDAGPLLTVKGRYRNNAVWLTYNYAADLRFVSNVPDLATRMTTSYGVTYLFSNIGHLNPQGQLANPPSHAPQFLNAVDNWERAGGARLTVVAWLNALTDSVNLSDPSVRATIRRECNKLLSPSATGSYVPGASRSFDGLILDFEPSGGDATRFAALIALVDGIRQDIQAIGLPNAKIGLAAHTLGTQNAYHWSADFYAQMAHHADFLCAMTYDSGISTAAAYQTWIENQLGSILAALHAGETQGQAPLPGFRLFVGLAAYPASSYHHVAAENIASGAAGLDAALVQLINAGDSSVQWFQGAAVFLHTDGSGQDGYAGWTTDWSSFQQGWLGVGERHAIVQ